ncbi:hypothetical protein BDW66DRAFT_138276 [Aspergillus desertorum]
MAQDAEKRQPLETFLSDWFRNKNGELETIYVIIVRKEDAKTSPKAQKEVKETKKEFKPAVRKKRSFSVASIKPEPEDMAPSCLLSTPVLLFKEEEDGVAYRTRKRHKLSQKILNGLRNLGQFNCCSLPVRAKQ